MARKMKNNRYQIINHPSSKNQGSYFIQENVQDVKVRGTYQQVFEKYSGLAQEAASSGDRILSENYYQHADHYRRLINEQGAILKSSIEKDMGRPLFPTSRVDAQKEDSLPGIEVLPGIM
jgi:hypothetical protein